jgi:hypothetical protein
MTKSLNPLSIGVPSIGISGRRMAGAGSIIGLV